MTPSNLRAFLTDTMSMSEVYQPVIIKELLENGGTCSKDHLAARLADHDESVQEYYRKILMRWPKITLTKHGVVEYDRSKKEFILTVDAYEVENDELIRLCEEKIEAWLASRGGDANSVSSSQRYEVLKAARGKCQLCGIPSSLRPIDVDHIVPQSKANRYGKVVIDSRPVDVNSIENLQALCFKCNRAKRDGDDTDWRTRDKLVRDGIPALIAAEGRVPYVVQLKGKKLTEALREKLIEEVGEYLDSGDVEELADVVEVVRSLAEVHGVSAKELDVLRARKRTEKGGFEGGQYYSGDKSLDT
jgi:predicted house-cleaning noncanonical NTP pyrophosphatase (MazG superfamily)